MPCPFSCPPPEARLHPNDSDTLRKEEIKGLWQQLKTVLREAYGEKGAWTHAEVKQWTKNANDASSNIHPSHHNQTHPGGQARFRPSAGE